MLPCTRRTLPHGNPSTCNTVDPVTLPFTARNRTSPVPYDPINNQYGKLRPALCSPSLVS